MFYINHKYHLLVLVISTLFGTNSILPIIVHGKVLEKTDPITKTVQKVRIVGDDHVCLNPVSAFFVGVQVPAKELHGAIKQRIEDEQNSIINYAKENKVTILAEDMYDYEPNNTLLNRIITAVPAFVQNGLMRLVGPDYFLTQLIAKAHKQGAKAISIEARHNAIALLSLSYFLPIFAGIAALSWKTKKYTTASTIASSLYLSSIASALYGIRYQYNTFKKEIDKSICTDKIYEQWQKFSTIYKENNPDELSIFRKTFEWVAAKAVATIVNNPNEHFIVCAGTEHCYNIEQALYALGFSAKNQVSPEECKKLWNQKIDYKKPFFDIKQFFHGV